MKKLILTVATAGALCLAPTSASAEWILTPFIGASFATGTDVDNVEFDTLIDGSKMTYGGTFTYLGGGVLGFEVDFGYSPEFFEDDDDDLDFIDSSNYSSLMANVVLSAPMGAFRPYGTAGLGMINTSINDVEDIFDLDRIGGTGEQPANPVETAGGRYLAAFELPLASLAPGDYILALTIRQKTGNDEGRVVRQTHVRFVDK